MAALALAATTALTALPLAAPASAAPPEGAGRSAEALAERADREGPLRLVVEIDSTRNGPAVAAEARRNGGRPSRVLDQLPYVMLRAGGQAIRALDRRRDVVGIWEDQTSEPHLASTLGVINADDTQALGWTGAGTTVAVLDTGIDADHPFFNDNNGGGGSRILAQACFSDPDDGGNTNRISLCPNGGTTDTSADVDGHAQCTAAVNRCDHGTHVAGIAVGDATGLTGAPGNGVAPDANLLPVQVFTRFNAAGDCNPNPAPCVRTFDSDQIAGLNQVAAWNTANPGWNITAVNMSLGGGNNSAACDGDARKTAIDALLGAGVATVISSGNNSFLNSVGAPGCISTAVTVGNTADDDSVWPSSNRGPLLDIFAPGGNVVSAIVDDTYGSKNGTSMSAPHVAGAFSVLRQAYPTRPIGTLLADITGTGVPITYATDMSTPPATATTPRLDLLAALQEPNSPPALTVDRASVTVPEGSIVTNTGTITDPEGDAITALTASVGLVVRDGTTWSWRWRPADGPVHSQTVTISGVDDKGETGTVSFPVTVTNVAPSVAIAPAQVTTLDEGGTVTVTAAFSDPGYLDTHSATIDWGVPPDHEGEVLSGPTLVVNDPGGQGILRRGTVTGTYRYGDNSAAAGFPVTVRVTDKDGGSGTSVVTLTVRNVAPSTGIDDGGTVLLTGVPTLVAHAGESVSLSGGATDPGSDDLSLAWGFGDGTTSTTVSRVNPPTADPLPSPTVQPRAVSDSVNHAFLDACLYTVDLTVTDDDGGSVSDTIPVVITGNATLARSSGYWSAEYREKRSSDFTAGTLQCYLDIVNHVSAVFSESRALGSFQDAADALKTNGASSADAMLDAQLLAAWLNFANGVYDLDELVDTDGDGTADTAFHVVLLDAEALRLDPARARADVLAMKNVLERLNNP